MDIMDIAIAKALAGGGGGGGGSAFVVNVVVEYDDKIGTFRVISADKTFNEIKTAYSSGQNLTAKVDSGTTVYVMPLANYIPYVEGEQTEQFVFSVVTAQSSNMEISYLEETKFTIDSNAERFEFGYKEFN